MLPLNINHPNPKEAELIDLGSQAVLCKPQKHEQIVTPYHRIHSGEHDGDENTKMVGLPAER